ncbi:unnamed protein product, partial [Ectocarpus fasciculatus]
AVLFVARPPLFPAAKCLVQRRPVRTVHLCVAGSGTASCRELPHLGNERTPRERALVLDLRAAHSHRFCGCLKGDKQEGWRSGILPSRRGERYKRCIESAAAAAAVAAASKHTRRFFQIHRHCLLHRQSTAGGGIGKDHGERGYQGNAGGPGCHAKGHGDQNENGP